MTTLHRIHSDRRRSATPVRVALGVVIAAAVLALIGACAPPSEAALVPRSTLFVGVDVSGSFQKGGRYDDAMAFAGRYIYAHLNGSGGLEQPRALFVGAIGGERPGEPQAFHPIHDFEGKTPEEIEADLRKWFRPDDRFTDFNAFFRRAATLVQRQNLTLAPITLVLLTDGVPDMQAGQTVADEVERYQRIDLDPLEYLARTVTVRLLYPEPTVAVHWERDVPRNRVRMWTVDAVVMRGWREQFEKASAPDPHASIRHIAAAEYNALRRAEERPERDRTRADETGASEEPGEPAGESADAQAGAAGAGAAGFGAAGAADAPVLEAGFEAGAGNGAGNGATRAADGAAGAESPDAVDQSDLWRWMEDNVDYRVRRTVF